MISHFTIGINFIFDPTGVTAYSNTYFVSKSGNDANPGTPQLPKLTIAAALSIGSTVTVVVGTGVYEEYNLQLGGRKIMADGCVFVNGTNTSKFIQSTATYWGIEGLIFTNWITAIYVSTGGGSNRKNRITDITIFGGVFGYTGENASGKDSTFKNNKFINATAKNLNDSISPGSIYRDHIFINSSYISLLDTMATNVSQLGGFVFDENSTIQCTLTFAEKLNNCCIFGSSPNKITIDGNAFDDLASAKIAYPNAFPNSFNADPLFIGDPSKGEFIVSKSSPLLGAGISGQNIGNVKTGSVHNSASSEFGISPASNLNTQWFNDELQVTTGIEGRRESASIDLGQVFTSPKVQLNAIIDALNHTPDAENNLINPNHLVFEAQWAGNDGIFNGAWKKFKFNTKMQIDGSGKYTGEVGFIAGSLVDIPMRYVKIAIVVRNDYNQL